MPQGTQQAGIFNCSCPNEKKKKQDTKVGVP